MFTLAIVATLALSIGAGPARGQTNPWPRRFNSSAGAFVVYQPQPEELRGDKLTGRVAFSVQKKGEDNPTFGVLWFQSIVQIDRDAGTVNQRDFDVTLVHVPNLSADDAADYEHLVEDEARHWDLSGSLQELQAGLAASAKERASIDSLSHRPPRIVFKYQRSLLVLYDGAPMLEPIDNSRLQRVSNTPFAVVYDPDHRFYYLSGANLWYVATDPLGPWSVIDQPPSEVAGVVPPDTTAADRVTGTPPAIVTATQPTELISFDGEPQLEPLVDGKLLYATNTESDVLRDIDTRSIYVLLSGRWYTAKSEAGPWSWVPPDSLPEEFSRIPPDSPKGALLASVAGTDQADDAVADNEIPQTSPIRRDATDVGVVWDGPPDFEHIAGTDLEYGLNTESEVLFDGRHYFLCDQGVWYVSDDANGPWDVSVDVPDGLDDLPPTCPVYNVRYVVIYEVGPDVVYDGYLPGYLGHYPCQGVVVYGTGYYYHPWRSRHHYYPRPVMTWGFHAWYNPWVSRWSYGFSYWSGFYRVGTRWWARGPRRRSPLWFGPGGYHRPWLAGDLTPVRTPEQHTHTGDHTPVNLYNRVENAGRVVRPLGMPVTGTQPKTASLPNNVFAGKDGKVYQRTNGGWNVNQGRQWVKTTLPPTSTPVTPPYQGVAGVQRPGARPMTQPASQPQTRYQPPSQPQTRYQPPARPMTPAPQSYSPPPSWRTRPAAPSSPPTLAPSPGGLEREFQARQRGGGPAPVMTPQMRVPQPQQPKKEPERDKKKEP
jgi:hypothetical protein